MLKVFLSRVLSFVLLLLLSSCASYGGQRIEAVERSLADLRKIVTQGLPLGMRTVSTNGREFYSKYFVVKDREFVEADNAAGRSYAVIYILGDRRPYAIEVVVHNEEINQAGQYVRIGKDQRIAEVIRRRLLKELSKRREEINIIDDFRAF